MKKRSLGVICYSDAFTGTQLTEYAQRIEALGYETLWYVEALNYESFACGAHLLSATRTLQVGAGIANIYARDPMAALQGARSLHEFSGGRFILGLGVSHDVLVRDVRGHRYQKPLSMMRSYLDGMDAARPVVPGEDPPVVLAALGPRMLSLAGERTQGVMPFNCPPEHTAAARDRLGPDKWICTGQHLCRCEDPDQARAIARQALAFYVAAPNYYNNWFRFGFEKSDLENGGSDRLVDRLVAWGSLDHLRTRIDAHFDAGATQVVLNPIAYGSSGAPIAATIQGHELGYACLPDWNLLEALAPNQ